MTTEKLEKRVLVGDDHPEMIQKVLSFGFENDKLKGLVNNSIKYATTPKEVIDLVKNKDFKLVITDCNYSDDFNEEGYDVIKQIRSFNKNVPIFMYTSGASEKKARELGANGFISKVDYKGLKETIIKYIQGDKKEK